MAISKAPTPAKRATSSALVKELRTMLRDIPVEVLGHIEAAGVCCGNGTVALVKIDKGDPAPVKKAAPVNKAAVKKAARKTKTR